VSDPDRNEVSDVPACAPSSQVEDTTATPALTTKARIAELEAAVTELKTTLAAMTEAIEMQAQQLAEWAERYASLEQIVSGLKQGIAGRDQNFAARIADLEARLLRPVLERDALEQKAAIPVFGNSPKPRPLRLRTRLVP
jgi:vacuolar-type H+-ATPase catalytic subunit A/Vma1